MDKLIKIQNALKAPKNQYNSFGKYHYRNQEDILEAVKPLLIANGCTLTITDEVREVASIPFVEAKAVFTDGENTICSTAQAGINPNRKGMDIAQSFGSSSSYARKYALNGLFLIDDTKDADAINDHTSKPMLTEKGFTFLTSGEATIEQVKKALQTRDMSPAQKQKLQSLTIKIKKS
tara:strand:- start:4204 stop:4737 length:534 start_codon:yes stop_codon:yes gene_type:complete